MKAKIVLPCLLLVSQVSFSQWVSNGSNIENTNDGDVVVGNASNLKVYGKMISYYPKSNSPLSGEFFGTSGWWGFRTDTGNKFHIDIYNSNNPKSAFVIDQTGKVGIGTTTPSYQLEVSSSSAANLRLVSNGSTSGSPAIDIFDNVNGTEFVLSPSAGKVDLFTYSNHALALGTGNTEKIRITPSGNVGIGTSNPLAKLTTEGSIWSNATRTNTVFSGWIEADNANFVGSEGYWALRTATDNSFNLDVYNGNNPKVALNIDQTGIVNIGGETPATTGEGSKLSFLGASSNGDALYIQRYNKEVNKSELRVNIGDDYGQSEDMFVVGTHHWQGGWYPHLAVQASGNVGIGTIDSRGYKLAVAGKIISEEVVVKLQTNWPDYVFEKDYELPSLEELQLFIAEHKHLPGVPSAKEVEEKGLSVGEMNAVLLKKIEELTLYAIEMSKKVEEIKKENESMKIEMKQLKNN